MTRSPALPARLSHFQSLIDDCTEADLSLINAYIVDRAKQLQANELAEQMARFAAGDRVHFDDKEGRRVEAVVVRINKKTVSLMSDAGQKWNVSPELLHKIDITVDAYRQPTQLSLVQDDKSDLADDWAIIHDWQWVGGWIDAPGMVTGEPGAPYRPRMHVWLNDSGQVIRMSMTSPDQPDIDPVLELVKAIREPLAGPPGVPSRIRVNDAEQARTLQASFPSIDVVCAATPELSELQSTMEKSMAPEDSPWTYSDTAAGNEAIGSFFEAAAALYRAAPWNLIPHNDYLIGVSIEALGLKNAVLSVIGQTGQHFGIMLFENLSIHERHTLFRDALDRGREPDYPPHIFLSYDPAKEVAPSIRKDISRHGWQVANTLAYPILMAPVGGQIMRHITAQDLTLFNVLARVLTTALSNEGLVTALTGGTPTVIEQPVSSDSGALKVVLKAPFPYEDVMRENGAVDSILARLIAMERSSEEMDDDLHHRLTQRLQKNYQASPEGRAVGMAASVSTLIIDFSFNYLDRTVATLEPAGLEQILFEIIPAKVMMPASEADNLIEDARAFYRFLKRAYRSVHAERCLEILTDEAAARMRAAMDNPASFGMGKSVLSQRTGFPSGTPHFPGLPGLPPKLPDPSATKPKPKDRKSRKKQRSAARKSRKKNR